MIQKDGNSTRCDRWQDDSDSDHYLVPKKMYTRIILFLTVENSCAIQSIFGWDIDFARQLKDGDQFAVVYDERFWGNEKVENGPILAAEFTNNGNRLRAIRHLDEEGGEHYFTPQGKNLRGTFLRAPVKVDRKSVV